MKKDQMATEETLAPTGDSRPAGSLDEYGKYEILGLLGQGGMGQVYKARDRRLDRLVALKFLTGNSKDRLDRFLNEARAQARVRHDNICEIYEVGRIENRPYIAVQYIDGETLDKASVDLTLEQKTALMRDVARGLHAAHRSGLIHRDIKPSNIMVERRETGELRPYVLDFGLAREIDAPGVTATGIAVGTPSYMAPEQALGETEKLDRRTDVYGLGSTLYSLLTGKPPFGEGTALEVLRRVIKDDPEPPRRFEKSIPVDIDTIVTTCLHKERQKRYGSANALADDLQRYLDGEPIQARPVSRLARMAKKVRRHRAVLAATAIAVTAILVLGGLHLRSLWRWAEQTREAQRFGEEVKEIESVLRLARMSPIHEMSQEREKVRGRIERMEKRMETSGTFARGPGHYAAGRGYMLLGEHERAREHLEHALAEGFDDPNVSYSLGIVLGELYRRELEKVRQTGSRGEGEGIRREIATRYRDPAVARLKEAKGITIESPAYSEALLAFYEERWDAAVDLAGRALDEIPWMYEALRLQGDVLYARAKRHERDLAWSVALADYEEANARYEAAIARAPSDGANYEHQARSLNAMLCALHFSGDDPRPMKEAAISAGTKALLVNPESAEAYSSLGYAHYAIALHRWERLGQAPLPLSKR